MPANDRQVGGDHYKGYYFRGEHIEPWDVVNSFGLGYLDGVAVVYLLRWRAKGGVEDIQKAIHTLEKLVEVETQAESQRPGADDR